MKRQTVDQIYNGFNNVGVLSVSVLTACIIGYYTLNEIGVKKYNGLIRTLIPVALIELITSTVVINVIDYRLIKGDTEE